MFLYCVEEKLFSKNFESPVANSRLKGQIGQYNIYEIDFVRFIHMIMKTLWWSFLYIPSVSFFRPNGLSSQRR